MSKRSKRMVEVTTVKEAGAGATLSEERDSESMVRGRPGRRTFGLSRQAYYASQRPAAAPKVVRMPVRPNVAAADTVLAAIRVVIRREPAWGVRKVWATERRWGWR